MRHDIDCVSGASRVGLCQNSPRQAQSERMWCRIKAAGAVSFGSVSSSNGRPLPYCDLARARPAAAHAHSALVERTLSSAARLG